MRSRRQSASRLSRLRSNLRKQGLDSFLVTFLPNVRYLTGFTGSSGAVLIDGRTATFVTDFRYRAQARQEVSQCRCLEQQGTLAETVARLVRKKRLGAVAFESRHVSVASYRDLSRKLKGVRFVPTEGVVEDLRVIKDAGEVALIREAIRVAGQSYRSAARRLVGRREIEVAASIESSMRGHGAEAEAFPPIVASGKAAALPHATPGKRVIRPKDLVVIDFGARCKGYHSDITRTRLPGGSSARARRLYRLVEEAQRQAIAAIRPGVPARVVDEAARTVIAAAGYGDLFGHGTGHGVGLEVHERPGISSRSEEPLQPGMIFTIEPGVYVEDFGGVRIEDMVLVTASGGEVLSSSIPRPAP